ncbi:MAG: hypothetical protein ACREKB_02625 [Candidatus Rokuibacteriota bacterium]
MRLITAHRILIAAGIVFFLFYAVFQGRRYLALGGGAALSQAIVSVAVAVLLTIYYRGLAKRWNGRS